MNFERVTDELALKLLRLATDNKCDLDSAICRIDKSPKSISIVQESPEKVQLWKSNEFVPTWRWELVISRREIRLTYILPQITYETVKYVCNPFEIIKLLNKANRSKEVINHAKTKTNVTPNS